MGWEQRGSRRYYYRARKVGGRVLKQYMGGGVEGRLAAAEDQLEKLQQAKRRREAQRLAEEARQDDQAHEDIDQAINATLEAAGFHRPKRGRWRRRRT